LHGKNMSGGNKLIYEKPKAREFQEERKRRVRGQSIGQTLKRNQTQFNNQKEEMLVTSERKSANLKEKKKEGEVRQVEGSGRWEEGGYSPWWPPKPMLKTRGGPTMALTKGQKSEKWRPGKGKMKGIARKAGR